jgi:hypothetical protein
MYRALACPQENNPDVVVYFDRVIKELLADGLTPIVTASVVVGAKSVYILPITGAQQVVTDRGVRKVFANRSLNIVGFLDEMDGKSQRQLDAQVVGATQYRKLNHRVRATGRDAFAQRKLHFVIDSQLLIQPEIQSLGGADNRHLVAAQLMHKLARYLPYGYAEMLLYVAEASHYLRTQS